MSPSSKRDASCGNQLIHYGERLTVYITDLFKALLQLKQTTNKKTPQHSKLFVLREKSDKQDIIPLVLQVSTERSSKLKVFQVPER